LIRRLSAILEQQLSLDVFHRPSEQYREQFNAIVSELERLRDEALRVGGTAEDLQQQILDLQAEQTRLLETIDTKIEAEQKLQDELSKQEQATIAANAAKTEAAIAAAQATADAKIDELREAAKAELERLAEIEKDLLSRQEAILLSDRDVLMGQLDELKKLNVTAADLLRITYENGPEGRGDTATITAADLLTILDIPNPRGSHTTLAAAGFNGIVTQPHLFLAGEAGGLSTDLSHRWLARLCLHPSSLRMAGTVMYMARNGSWLVKLALSMYGSHPRIREHPEAGRPLSTFTTTSTHRCK